MNVKLELTIGEAVILHQFVACMLSPNAGMKVKEIYLEQLQSHEDLSSALEKLNNSIDEDSGWNALSDEQQSGDWS